RQYMDVLTVFSAQKQYLANQGNDIFGTEMWHETNAQTDKTIVRKVHFANSNKDMIYSGPHIGVGNPFFKTPRRKCILKSDYDSIDLESLSENYKQRSIFDIACGYDEYQKRVSQTPWDQKCNANYRVAMRNMFNQSGERTLVAAIIPPSTGHVHAVYEIDFKNERLMVLEAGMMASIPFDFYIKITGKGSGGIGVVGGFPIIESVYDERIMANTLLLNCLTKEYSQLWNRCWKEQFKEFTWAKNDHRLDNSIFCSLTHKWNLKTPLRKDYVRRQALIELDVLTAMGLGITLDQLKTIYKIQFPVLQSYEDDTWYDYNGRIVFTNNRSLTGIGFPRKEWESIKNVKEGTFTRTITDDTLPGGPIERTIEYVAPFDRCDREKDYEEVWANFEKRFRNK
ncbi:MAG: class I SAM-dependent DNA methyltransferase, partial [Oscillospiraceae bacterium]|nr:class I SAM-dependent DNA methyltransferase [Oscillospiraceae bacterium]